MAGSYVVELMFARMVVSLNLFILKKWKFNNFSLLTRPTGNTA